jgi:hypothetical protein
MNPSGHASANQFPLELSHGADDRQHQPAAGRRDVQIIAQRDERHALGLQVLDCCDQVLKASTEAVQLPAHDSIEHTGVGSRDHPVEFWTGLFRARDSEVAVLAGYGPAAALSVLPKLRELHLGILAVQSRHARVERHAVDSVSSDCGLMLRCESAMGASSNEATSVSAGLVLVAPGRRVFQTSFALEHETLLSFRT